MTIVGVVQNLGVGRDEGCRSVPCSGDQETVRWIGMGIAW